MSDGASVAPGQHPVGSAGELTHAVSQVCELIAPAFGPGVGASRDQLLGTAVTAWASAPMVSLLMRLPNRYHSTIDDVGAELRSCLAV